MLLPAPALDAVRFGLIYASRPPCVALATPAAPLQTWMGGHMVARWQQPSGQDEDVMLALAETDASAAVLHLFAG